MSETPEDTKKPFWNFSESNKAAYAETVEWVTEMQEKIIEYFDKWATVKKFWNKKRECWEEIKIFSITWLVLYLGFCDRSSFYKYEKKEAFRHTIKKARSFIENEYEEMLQTWNTTWAIFALKNFKWKDIQTHEWELNDNGSWKFVIEHIKWKYEDLDADWNAPGAEPLQLDEAEDEEL